MYQEDDSYARPGEKSREDEREEFKLILKRAIEEEVHRYKHLQVLREGKQDGDKQDKRRQKGQRDEP